ncbi:DNA polymerase III subunit delta [Lichenibacterium dinghuense]|uniref:DNA polymerase III subunit delta n=1 Tax=Lichenibacterium dinghuense TaxID=2895977 RepID=UPI001EFFFD85|nr:DNA polymerase III subunit delta [Lichenibacterium sp. 6Y81]
MVAIKNHEAERFLQRDVGSYSTFLLHGTDVGLVSERVRRIVKGLVDDPADPFQLVRLAGEDLSGDAARLVDEALTVPLFGGRRAVLLDATAGKKVEAAVDLLLAQAGACPVVISAGNLKKDSGLRKAVERSRTAAAIECYPDGDRELAALVDVEAAGAGLTIDADARSLLVSLLGSDRLASRSEIGKLLLYAHGSKAITAEHVVEAVADASVQANDDAVDAAFSGDMASLDAAMNKLHLGPVEAGLLLGAALRHGSALHKAKLAGPGGDSPFRFGLSPKRKAAVERQLAAIGPDALARNIVRIGEGIALVRREPRLAVDHATRVLWAVALSARPRAGRG